jgi:uncharacterized membrane protein YgcG
MHNAIDFSSWQSLLTTLLGLGVVMLIMVGVRLLVMQTVQRRRERENRQINERLRTLIAAYKVLGGSFTGELAVDPAHRRDLALRDAEPDTGVAELPGSERRRRIRDAVEAALSDVILLGTAEQVALAVAAANELVAGRKVHTEHLVVALRTYIREVLDLEPLSANIPQQGPARGLPAGRGGAKAGSRGEGGGTGGRGGQGGGGGSADSTALAGVSTRRSADD